MASLRRGERVVIRGIRLKGVFAGGPIGHERGRPLMRVELDEPAYVTRGGKVGPTTLDVYEHEIERATETRI